MQEEVDHVVVYTDGSYFYETPQHRPHGGSSCYFGEHSPWNVKQYFDEGKFGTCSPLRTEVYAAVLAATQAIHMGYKKVLIKQDCLNCIVLLRVFGDHTQPLKSEYREDPLLVQWWRCLQRIEVELEHVRGHLLPETESLSEEENEILPLPQKGSAEKKAYENILDLFIKGALESRPQSAAEIKAKRIRKRKRLLSSTEWPRLSQADLAGNAEADRMARYAAIQGQSLESRKKMDRLNPIFHPWKVKIPLHLARNSWLYCQFHPLFQNSSQWNVEQINVLESILDRQEKFACCPNLTSTVKFDVCKILFPPSPKKTSVCALEWHVLQRFWEYNPTWLISLHDSTKPLFPQWS